MLQSFFFDFLWGGTSALNVQQIQIPFSVFFSSPASVFFINWNTDVQPDDWRYIPVYISDLKLACVPRSVLLTDLSYSEASHSSQIDTSVLIIHLSRISLEQDFDHVPLSAVSSQTNRQLAAWIFFPPLCVFPPPPHHRHRLVGHRARLVQQSMNVNCLKKQTKKKQQTKQKKAIFCTWHQVDTATECFKCKAESVLCFSVLWRA